MDKWDQQYIDLIEPGYIEFVDNGFGYFHFWPIYAKIDYRVNDNAKVELSFYDDEESQKVCGRGLAKMDDKGLYKGF